MPVPLEFVVPGPLDPVLLDPGVVDCEGDGAGFAGLEVEPGAVGLGEAAGVLGAGEPVGEPLGMGEVGPAVAVGLGAGVGGVVAPPGTVMVTVAVVVWPSRSSVIVYVKESVPEKPVLGV